MNNTKETNNFPSWHLNIRKKGNLNRKFVRENLFRRAVGAGVKATQKMKFSPLSIS